MKSITKLTTVTVAMTFILGLFPPSTLAVSEISVEWLVEPALEFDAVMPFNEGFAVVGDRDSDSKGAIKYGFVDKTGKLIVPCIYGSIEAFSDGLAAVWEGGADGKRGFMDKSGNMVVPFGEYDFVKSFSEGLAAVSKDGKSGYIDKAGDIAIPFVYDNTWPFSEGLALVHKDDKYGYIDKNGNLVIPFEYEYAGAFSDGLAIVGTWEDHKFGFIDKTGNVVIPIEYSYAEPFSEGLAWVRKDDLYGYIDKTGNVVIPFEYGHGHDKSSFSEGLAAVWQYGKCGFIDKSGNIIVPLEYDLVEPFSYGFAVVSQYGKDDLIEHGLINKTGAFVIPFGEYDYIQSFSNGLAWVQKDGKWGILRIVYSATPTASTVLVNGANVAFDAYNINDNNFFKLRDLAYILSGTEKQFEIGWDAANDAISLTSGQPYTPVGGEMVGKGSGEMTALPTTSRITLDGVEITLTAYNIGGNNYFRLRDVGAAFDFGVDWDGANNTIVIDTSKGYTPE